MPPAPPVSLRLLGTAGWRRGSEAWRPLADKDALLLALLAIEGRQPRARLSSLLWPEVTASRAKANLRQRLFRIRRVLGDVLNESDEGVQLAAAVRCDLSPDEAADDADTPSDLQVQPLSAVDVREEGLALQEWLADARAAWAQRQPERLAAQASREESAGRLAAAIASSEALLRLDPLHEHAWRRLMRLHYLRGDRAAAVSAFERCEQVLRGELGLRPAAETLALLALVEQMGATPLPAATARRLLPASLSRPPRIVGRESAWTALEAAWEAGRAFVVIGEAGLGKSRLLADWAAGRDGLLAIAAAPGDELLPYACIARLLRALGGTPPAELLRRELARLLPEWGPAPASPGHPSLLAAAVDAQVASAPQAGWRAVLVDDLHHADPASRGLLQRLAAQPGLAWGFATRPLAGPEWQGWLGSSARLQRVTLEPLMPEELEELLQSLCVEGLDSASLAPALARHCGGNPLFTLETLRHLLREGASADAELPLPSSVEDALRHRLNALSDHARALVRVAAVAGADFGAELAADVLAQPLMALAEPLAELEQAQVFRQAGFAHEAVLDVARQDVPQPLRSALHARIAAGMAQQGAPAARVAAHWAEAGEWRRAGLAAREAAALAQRVGAVAERAALLGQASAWFAAAQDVGLQFDVDLARIDACMATDGVEPALELAAALVPRALTAAQRVVLRLAQANAALAGYQAALAVSSAEAAALDAEPGSRQQHAARITQAAGLALLGRVPEALEIVAVQRAALPDFEAGAEAAELWSQVALVYNSAGRTLDCVSALEQQRRIALACGHVETEVAALSSLSGQHLALGDSELAIREAREAAQLYRRMGASALGVIGDVNLATALIGHHELAEAMDLLARSLDFCRRTSMDSDLRLAIEELRAACWLRQGHPDLALAELDREPPQSLAPTRRLARTALRAQLATTMGEAALARDLWLQLRQMPAEVAAALGRLAVRAASTCVLDDAAALEELAALEAQAGALQFPSGQAVVRSCRVARHLAAGRAAAALGDVQALLAARERCRHRFVDEVEVLALCVRALAAAGKAEAAGTLQAEAAVWLQQVVQPRLLPDSLASWHRRPAVQQLLARG